MGSTRSVPYISKRKLEDKIRFFCGRSAFSFSFSARENLFNLKQTADPAGAKDEMVNPSKETNHQEYDLEEASEDGGSAAVDRERRKEENADEGVEPRGEDDGDEEKEEEEEGAEEEEDFRDTAPSTASYLVELNLLIVALSLLSEPTEESMDGEERTEIRIFKSHEEQVSASRLRPQRRREMNEFKVLGRQTPRMRFQTTIKDSRHCRRL